MTAPSRGYRDSKHVIPGFNLAVVDVDGQISINTAQLLLGDLKYLLYTTKRHTEKDNRFRIIFPLSHKLKLSKNDFKEFMENLYDWLPFEVDKQTSDYARKWLTNTDHNEYHEGELLDATLFIPKTKKSEERKLLAATQEGLTNIERWFVRSTEDGNRNNQILRYALMLVDMGMNQQDVQDKVIVFNDKLVPKLEELEIHRTIMRTVSKSIIKRDGTP